MIPDWVKTFYQSGIEKWPLASENIKNLEKVKVKKFDTGPFQFKVQFNPARAVSTLANVTREALEKRECFLCENNRPAIQKSFNILTDWDFLINPYPILPYHFTIVNKHHTPQSLDVNIGRKLALALPGMVVFYNSQGAGASAPDHAHFQAVPIRELPLIDLLERKNRDGDFLNSLPFKIFPIPKDFRESFPLNAYFWLGENGKVNDIIIPRSSHRPSQYFLDPPYRRAVSPGGIDMGGVFVTPFEEDFLKFTSSDIIDILHQVGLRNF